MPPPRSTCVPSPGAGRQMSCSSSWSRLRLAGPVCTTRCMPRHQRCRRNRRSARSRIISTRTSVEAPIRWSRCCYRLTGSSISRRMTVQYPTCRASSLATMFRSRGYRTTFVTPSDMAWAGWRGFLEAMASRTSWITATLLVRRCSRRGASRIAAWSTRSWTSIAGAARGPFFVTAWTTQTHHPYEPSPECTRSICCGSQPRTSGIWVDA